MASAPEVVDLLSSSDDEEKAQKTTEMMMHHQNAGKNSTHGNFGRKSHSLAQTKTADECKSKRQRRTLNDYFGGISSDSSDDDSFVEKSQPTSNRTNTPKQAATHLLEKKRSSSTSIGGTATVAKKPRARCNNKFAEAPRARKRPLQAGLVLEEDIFAANHKHLDQEDEHAENCATRFIRQQHERIANGEPPLLFQDDDFGPEASAIDGIHKKSMFRANNKKKPTPAASAAWHQNPWIQDDDCGDPTLSYPKCWCKRPAKLCFKRDGGKAYFACSAASSDGTKSTRCRYFSWAFRSELMPWYRYGGHNQHVLVKSPVGNSVSADTLFSAHDLVQGKVGDCWFLSALAVVAERPDLIQRLFQQQESSSSTTINAAVANWLHQDGQWGMVRVNLFLDGFWAQVILDNFLPCMLGQVDPKEEEEVKRAIEESLKPMNENASKDSSRIRNPYTKQASLGEGRRLADGKGIQTPTDSDCNPFALSEINLQIMQQTKRFLDKQRFKSVGRKSTLDLLDRPAESQDLAYSKARRNQLWVPFLEKAYAKVHGSYSAISGGHIAEAFLDLTGAPTLQIQWHQNGARHNSNIVEPRTLWSKLLQWRAKRLPMGCGTDSSAEGIIGMHAYSILDVREISNVGVEFFQEQMLTGSLGNVSGFTEYDGKVRLLRIRNPHGKVKFENIDFSCLCPKN
jgi:Calpain family cysteine protease